MLLPAQTHDAKQNYADVAFSTALTMVKILDISCHIVTMPKSPVPPAFLQGPDLWIDSKHSGLISTFPRGISQGGVLRVARYRAGPTQAICLRLGPARAPEQQRQAQ